MKVFRLFSLAFRTAKLVLEQCARVFEVRNEEIILVHSLPASFRLQNIPSNDGLSKPSEQLAETERIAKYLTCCTDNWKSIVVNAKHNLHQLHNRQVDNKSEINVYFRKTNLMELQSPVKSFNKKSWNVRKSAHDF